MHFGMQKPSHFPGSIPTISRSSSGMQWGVEIIEDRHTVVLTGGLAQEEGGRHCYFEFFNKHLQSRCPYSMKLYTKRKRSRGGRGISIINVLFNGVIKKHSYYLSVSFLFQLRRACNPMKPHMGKNLLIDPSWHISRLWCVAQMHRRKQASRKSKGTCG